jgi:DNA mismatch repair protein MutS
MSFITDSQTLEDLNLLGRFRNNSIYRIFDHVHTKGARKLLEHYFRNPLSDFEAINTRCAIFKYFGEKKLRFPFEEQSFFVMEDYLSSASGRSLSSVATGMVSKKIASFITQDPQYEQLQQGMCKTIALLNVFCDFIASFEHVTQPNAFSRQLELIDRILKDDRIKWVFEQRLAQGFGLAKLIRYDYILRSVMRDEMKVIIDIIYQIDINIAVSATASEKGFIYPKALPAVSNRMQISGLYHPALSRAVANSVSMQQDSNVIFLTGANMAGKSTIMKSVSIAFYLAHMGFPVAADNMEFSVKQGLFTSINVSDEISSGYSHFYAEVMRVKKVALQVSESKDLLVIFDELFKGTNVKDAYDGTLSITKGFAENNNCFFIVSTHILEVGEALQKQCSHFQFLYLPTVMQGLRPKYTYKLEQGITSDRQGMLIIENEGILELIKSGISPNKQF